MLPQDDEWMARGANDCSQDAMENAHFASIGGLDQRLHPRVPDYVPESRVDQYLAGYTETAQKQFGDDWQTCEFSWKPALDITDDNQ